MKRLKVTIEAFYEIDDDVLDQAYGDKDIDAEGIAKVDMANYEDNNIGAEEILAWCDREEISVKIEAAP